MERRNLAARLQLLRRIRAEFEEMPDLKLTPDQASRLWALCPKATGRILDELVRDGFLRRADVGSYARLTLGA